MQLAETQWNVLECIRVKGWENSEGRMLHVVAAAIPQSVIGPLQTTLLRRNYVAFRMFTSWLQKTLADFSFIC